MRISVAIATPNFFDGTGERITFGGGERYLYTLWKVLTKAGAEVGIYQMSSKTVFKKMFGGMKVIGIPSRCDLSEYSSSFVDAFNTLTWHYDLRIYFILTFGWPAVVHPAIGVSHGIWMDYPSHPFHLQSQEGKNVYLDRLKTALSNFDAIISCDTNTIGTFSTLWPNLRERFVYVPNFVDTQEFHPRQEPRNWEKPRILIPRRLTSLRGVQKAIDLCQKFKEADWYLVGRGHENGAEEQLTAFLEKNHWDNVKWFWQEMDKMPPVYREADIALFLTEAAEGTSLAALEALASGLITVVTPVGGLTDIVLDGYNGFVVEPKHGPLETKLRWIIDNLHTSEMNEVRATARQIAVKVFNLKRWKERWFQVIKNVTGVNLNE